MSEVRKRRVSVLKKSPSGLVLDYKGWFHLWGLEAMEFENGCTNWTIAVIEDDDGLVHMVHPEFVKFG